ncbi:MAG: glycerophosphodiester phosphodiesterase [Pseudomonadota bacterium]
MKTPHHFYALILACSLPLTSFAFDLQGHRGARGLAPENTLAAFSTGLKTGVTTLELDIGVSADGVVMISHDPWLNPAFTRDANSQWLAGTRGPLIRSLTFAQLQTYDVGRINPASPYAGQFPSQQAADGQRMPPLAGLFEMVKAAGAANIRFNIETKLNPLSPEDTVSPETMTQALLKVVRDSGMTHRVTIQSFDWRSLRLVQQLDPAMPTACLSAQSATGDTIRDGRWTAGLKLADYSGVPQLAKAAGCAIWSPNAVSITEDLVKQAQVLGLKVVPWTVNAPSDMQRLLEWNVDGLITDYPDRLRTVMQQRGMPLPAALGR